MSSGALRQIFALFDVDTGAAVTKLQALTKSTTDVKEVLATLAGTAFAAFSLHGIASFIESQIELGSVINDTAEKLGLGTDELQRFQFAAGLSGVNAEEAGRALGFLNKNMGEALAGNKESVQQFAELGIAIKDGKGDVRELGDMIPEVADAFAKMGSDQERTATAMKLFGKSGASLLPLLKQGSGELSKLNEEFTELGLGIDDDFIKKADEAGDKIDTMKLGFRALKTRLAAEFLPTITEASKKLSQWIVWGQKLVRETHIVKEGMYALGGVAAVAAGKTFYSWSKVLGLFPKGGSLIGNLFKMGEIGLIIGALVLLGLAIEDIVVMCQGGESVIGSFLDEMLGVEYRKELVSELTRAWQDMQPALNDLKPLVHDIGKAFAAVLPYAIALVVDLIRFIAGTTTSVIALGKALAGLIRGDSTDKIADEFMKGTDGLFGPKGILSKSTTWDLINAPAQVPASAAGVPFGPPAAPNMAVNTTIQVNGAGDPNVVAQRVAGLQRGAADKMASDAANALARGTE
jgi:hypothetical protein